MKKVLSDNTELFDWVKRRVFAHIPVLKQHKMRDRFITNYLAGYSSVAFGDENDRLMMPYRFSDQIRFAFNRYGAIAGSDVVNGFQQSMLRMGYEVGEEETLNFIDVNVGNARSRYNTLFSKSVGDRPSFRYNEITSDPSLSMRSRAMNWNHQYTLTANDFYSKHLLDLEMKVIATGTAYTRIDYDISLGGEDIEAPELTETFKFSYVPYYHVLDDGKYNSDSYYDIRSSRFVVQFHTWDKDTAIRNLSMFKSGVKKKLDFSSDIQGNLYYTNDLEDMGSFWGSYYSDQYHTLTVLEVFWKYFSNDTDTEFEWMRSFMVMRAGGLEEIITMPSEYAQGVPLIRKKHQLQPDSIYGFTDIPNQISLDNARNMVTSRFLNQAVKNSYRKMVISGRASNMQDTEGRRWTEYRDQEFTGLRLGPGEGVNNHIQTLQYPPINSDGLGLLAGLDSEQESRFKMPAVNPNRTTQSSLRFFYETMQEVYKPMLISTGLYYKELAEDINTIMQSEFTSEMWKIRRKEMGAVSGGMDLGSSFLDVPKSIGQLGIEVTMASDTESALNRSLEALAPFLQLGGMEALYNEEIIQLTGARDAGFRLPMDDQKKLIYRDIDMIVKGDAGESDIEDMILYIQTQGVDELTGEASEPERDYSIQNHELAVEVTAKYINDNRDVLKDTDMIEKFSNLLRYFQLHKDALMQNQAQQMEQMMQTQQMAQNETSIEPQGEPGRPEEAYQEPPPSV